MRIRSPSLPELHAFAAVVESGSFSRAAEALAVTQGAVSRSVLRLEARLGMTLLERGAGQVKPTPSGKAYYLQVKPALAALEAAVPRSASQEPHKLRLSALPTLGMRWLLPRLPRLHEKHPGLQVLFQPYSRDDAFVRDDVDCWLVGRPSSTSRWPRHIRATYVIGREIVAICHPNVAPRLRKPADLLALPLLHHTGFPGNWALWFEAHGIAAQRLKLGAGFDLGAGLIEAVAANMGVAVVQRCLLERDLADGRVVIPFPREVSTGRGYFLCMPRASEGNEVLESFRQWLLEEARGART